MSAITWKCSLEAPPRLCHAHIGRWFAYATTRFHIPKHWSLHQFWHGGQVTVKGPRKAQGTTLRLHPGVVTVFPPDTTREYSVPPKGAFSCIHFELTGARNDQDLPFLAELGGDANAFDRRLAQAIGCSGYRPSQAAAILWMLLWDLAEIARPLQAANRPRLVVEKVQEEIELRLHEPIRVADLARNVGVSEPHLRRLFRMESGMSVKRYLLERRLARARHLLVHTDHQVKAIAAEVGIPDLHHFNKFIRRELGRPPRAVRSGG